MRIEAVWDKWMEYDEDGFCCGIRDDAPDEVKQAYAEYIAEREAAAKNGYIAK